MTQQWQLSGNAGNVNWSDLAMAGRASADNLVGEPAVSKVMHMMADEIERLRSENASHRLTNETNLSQQKPSVAFEVKVSEIQPRLMTTAVAQVDHRAHVAVANAAAVRPLHRPALIRPRNGALSPDPDSRVLETQRTPPPHPTPPQGSVPGEGGFPDSRTANEPVAWVAWFADEDKPDADFLFRNKEQADCWCRKRGADSVPLYLHPAPAVTAEPVAWWLRGPVAWWLKGSEYDTGCEYEYVSLVKESADAAAKEGGTVTPLYRSPTLTDEERAALERVCVAYELLPSVGAKQVADTLIKLLERTK